MLGFGLFRLFGVFVGGFWGWFRLVLRCCLGGFSGCVFGGGLRWVGGVGITLGFALGDWYNIDFGVDVVCWGVLGGGWVCLFFVWVVVGWVGFGWVFGLVG